MTARESSLAPTLGCDHAQGDLLDGPWMGVDSGAGDIPGYITSGNHFLVQDVTSLPGSVPGQETSEDLYLPPSQVGITLLP